MNAIEQRLIADGEQWREALPAPPDRPGLDRPPRRRRVTRIALPALAAAAVAAVVGVLVVAPWHHSPQPAGRLRTCGTVPAPSGPLAAELTASLTGPATAASGQTVDLTVHLTTSKTEISTSTGSVIPILITRGSTVIGQYVGAVAASAAHVELGAGRPYLSAAEARLNGCPTTHDTPGDLGRADSSRPPLPPGRYDLVAVLDFAPYPDPDAAGTVVSAPMAITVRSS